jgi:hypothetical protein
MSKLLLKIALVFSFVLVVGIFFVRADEGDVLFEDNFEDSKDLPDWRWDADDHEFARVATDGENRALRMVGSSDGSVLYSDVGEDWEHYALELRFQIVEAGSRDDYDFVLVIREDGESDASTGAIFASNSSEAVMTTFYEGEYREHDRIVYEFNTEEWYSVRFAVQGDLLELSINGEVLMQVQTDQQGERGGIGFVVGSNAVILFDDVRVTELAEPERTTVGFGDTVNNLLGDDETGEETSETTIDTVTAEVTVNTANLRSGPGTDNPIVAQASRGDVFEVIAQAGDGDDVWYRVVGDDPNAELWVFSGTVQIEPADAVLPEEGEN